MKYIEVIIEIPDNQHELSEILLAYLSDYFESFTEEQSLLKAYTSEKEFSEDFTNQICKKFNVKYKTNIISSKNWNEEWEKSFKPVVINKLLHIRAPFHNPIPGIKNEIVIEPKMAFGTGHHETTFLMCKLMSTYNFSKSSVLDMGCGTGILAIYSFLLGANNITAIDIDEWSFYNCTENCNTNKCNNIKIIQGDVESIPEYENYDFILANINFNVLINDIEKYTNKLNSNGKLILSGFFELELDRIKKICQANGLLFDKYLEKNRWIAVAFSK
jgi:ribosomal protein L11 methyltransferase